MLTPYRMDGAVDHEGLTALTHWYLATVAAGLFAACRPSEIFHLSPWGHGQAGGRKSDGGGLRSCILRAQDTLEEVRRMADAGADIFILISNRLAGENEKASAG